MGPSSASQRGGAWPSAMGSRDTGDVRWKSRILSLCEQILSLQLFSGPRRPPTEHAHRTTHMLPVIMLSKPLRQKKPTLQILDGI